MRALLFWFYLVGLLVTPVSLAHADGKKFQVATVEITSSRRPQEFIQFTKEVLNNREAKAAGVAAATYFLGVDPEDAAAVIEVAAYIVNRVVKTHGQDIWGEIGFSEEYSVCRVLKADEVSRNCSSSLDTNIGGHDGNQLSYYMHVPQADLGGPRCWIGAKFVVLAVKKSEKSSADCSENNARVLSCPSGSSCDHGPGVGKL